MNNLFLTGIPGVGKTTIIEKLIRELGIKNVGGYFTEREISADCRTFWIRDRVTNERRLMAEVTPPCNASARTLRLYPEAFEPFGMAAISRPCDLLVLDELGRFEKDCEMFKAAVHKALDGETPVIGVLKICDTPFVAAVRSRSDVTVLTVTEDNRETIYESARSWVKGL